MLFTKIIYTCPKCGADLEEIVLTSLPPVYEKRCNNCGYVYREERGQQTIRVPFVEPKPVIATTAELVTQVDDPCANCSNRPKDGEIKACFCTIGLPKITW